MASFTIGVLARSAGMSVETGRYYQRRGLIERPDGNGFGYRLVRRAKSLELTLKEIRELLGAARSRSAGEVLAAARAKLAKVEADARHLDALRCRLSRLVVACESGNDECVAIEAGSAAV